MTAVLSYVGAFRFSGRSPRSNLLELCRLMSSMPSNPAVILSRARLPGPCGLKLTRTVSDPPSYLVGGTPQLSTEQSSRHYVTRVRARSIDAYHRVTR